MINNTYIYNGCGGGGGWFGGGSGSGLSAGGGGGSGFVFTNQTSETAYQLGYKLPEQYFLTATKSMTGDTSFGNIGSGRIHITDLLEKIQITHHSCFHIYSPYILILSIYLS